MIEEKEQKEQAVYDGILIGQKIRDLRIKCGMSLGELSDDVGKSESHMKQVELGSRKMSLDLLLSLMTVFQTGANDILLYNTNSKEKESESIDSQLACLPENERKYLISIFQSMINEYPVAV